MSEEIVGANFDKEDTDAIFQELGDVSGYLPASGENMKNIRELSC